MSISSPAPPDAADRTVAFHVRTVDPLVEVTIRDRLARVVAAGHGDLSTRLTRREAYNVRFRAEETTRDEWIEIADHAPDAVTCEMNEFVRFRTTAPTDWRDRAERDMLVGLEALFSSQLRYAESPTVVVFVKSHDGELPRDILDGWEFEPSADRAAGDVLSQLVIRRDSWGGLLADAPSDWCVVRPNKTLGAGAFAVPSVRNCTTAVFLTTTDQPGCVLDLASAAVCALDHRHAAQFDKVGRRFIRWTELTGRALSRHTAFPPAKLLQVAESAAAEGSPMLVLQAAYLMFADLRRKEEASEARPELIAECLNLLPPEWADTADARVLRAALADLKGERPAELADPLSTPPLLVAAWRALVDVARNWPGVIREGSLLSRAGAVPRPAGPWFAWDADALPPAADPKAVVDLLWFERVLALIVEMPPEVVGGGGLAPAQIRLVGRIREHAAARHREREEATVRFRSDSPDGDPSAEWVRETLGEYADALNLPPDTLYQALLSLVPKLQGAAGSPRPSGGP